MRGIVFDMDGVLLLSSAIHAQAYREVLAGYPIPDLPYAPFAGMRTDDAMRKILAENGIAYSDRLIASLAAAKTGAARRMLSANMPIAPECVELIPLLADTYPLALASSASKESVDLFLDSSGLRIYFTAVVHGGDVQMAKPAPDIYRLAFARLGLPAEECLVVEDALSGVMAGKAAGAVVWGCSVDRDTADQLVLAGADRVIATLGDLYALCQ